MTKFLASLAVMLAAVAAVPITPEEVDANNMVNATALIEEETLAPDQVTRIADVAATNGNASFVFDFNNPPAAGLIPGSGGNITAATVDSFPALKDTNMALILFSLGPCGIVLPHTHPRSAEFVVVTEGQLVTQFLSETGSEVYTNQLSPYQSTLFPQGSLHVEYNPTCAPTLFLGAGNNEDPGTLFVEPGFFSLADQVVLASLGGHVSGSDLNTFRQVLTPPGIALVEQCLAACNMTQNAKRTDLRELL